LQEHEKLKDACTRILEENTSVKNVAKDGSKSVFFDARILAKEMERMSEVWRELLSYAASRCKVNVCAAQLSKGGEFITFVLVINGSSWHRGIKLISTVFCSRTTFFNIMSLVGSSRDRL
jgi:hypothetical protein